MVRFWAEQMESHETCGFASPTGAQPVRVQDAETAKGSPADGRVCADRAFWRRGTFHRESLRGSPEHHSNSCLWITGSNAIHSYPMVAGNNAIHSCSMVAGSNAIHSCLRISGSNSSSASHHEPAGVRTAPAIHRNYKTFHPHY